MISRRNIRVKVMQTLYTVMSSGVEGIEEQKKSGSVVLNDKLSRSLDLFIVSILYTLDIAQFAEKDARKRGAKYLPTDADLNVNTKIAGNEFLWGIKGNQTFEEKVKDAKLDRYIDEDWVKTIYKKLVESKEYIEYANTPERSPKQEKSIIKYIWEKEVLANEGLMEFFSDELTGWEDDKEMTEMLMVNFFKSSHKINFLNLISTEKREYAHSLLHAAIDKEEHCMELIQPKLINWDADRVALIDLLLLKMGVCELLYFPTIPTKVTINEYIEIAKLYSTPQSGQFVNGVLDNILKELMRDNKIRKQDRTRK